MSWFLRLAVTLCIRSCSQQSSPRLWEGGWVTVQFQLLWSQQDSDCMSQSLWSFNQDGPTVGRPWRTRVWSDCKALRPLTPLNPGWLGDGAGQSSVLEDGLSPYFTWKSVFTLRESLSSGDGLNYMVALHWRTQSYCTIRKQCLLSPWMIGRAVEPREKETETAIFIETSITWSYVWCVSVCINMTQQALQFNLPIVSSAGQFTHDCGKMLLLQWWQMGAWWKETEVPLWESNNVWRLDGWRRGRPDSLFTPFTRHVGRAGLSLTARQFARQGRPVWTAHNMSVSVRLK